MTKREMLLEQLEDTAFALMMEDVAKEEGRKALEENERLKADDSFIMPESTYRKGISTIKRHFRQRNSQTVMRTTSKVISRVAVIMLVMLLMFVTAFATIPEFRNETLNLIIDVFDDRTRIEFGETPPSASTNDSIVKWIPEGFELVDKSDSRITSWERYGNAEGALVEARIYHSAGFACEMDTEEAQVEIFEVNGHQATMVFKKENIQLSVPVLESKRIFSVRGKGVDRAMILRVAESMDIR